jgi:hypothetical protein
VRASEDSSEVDPTKAELQRRMEEARESISQTVTEIKDTVVTQYQQVRETISDTLDWREQYKRHTLPFTVGAFAAGALLGYTVMGAFKGEGDEDDYDTEDALEEGTRSYAASPIIGRSRSASSSAYSAESDSDVGPSPRPSYSSGYNAATAQQAEGLTSHAQPSQPAPEEEEEPKGPGLIERFKETKAYDRLSDELSTVGERVVEELSRTAQTVVVPMLLNKLKSLIGVDLSSQRGGSRQSAGGGQTSGAQPQGFASSGAGATGAPSQPSAGSNASASESNAGGSSARAAGAGGAEGHGAS